MEETHKIEPFNSHYLHETIFRYQELFLAEILKFGIVPAVFPDIMAKLYYHVNQRYLSEVDATELNELRTLLPEIEQPFYDQLPLVAACDLFSRAEIDAILQDANLAIDAPCLRPIAVQIARLLRLSDRLSTDQVLCELLLHLVKYYENFRAELCAPGTDRSELLTPKATICGIDLQHYELSYETALRIICRTPTGASNRENKFGNHPGVKIYGTYCKPVGISDTLGTGKENAAVKFCQLFNRKYRVATPVTLLKVSHVKLNTDKISETLMPILKRSHQHYYMERIVQAAMLCEGELLQLVLELLDVFKHWQKTHGDHVLVELLKQAENGNLDVLKATSGLDQKAQQDIPLYLQTLRRIVKDYTPEHAVAEFPLFMHQIDRYSLCSAILTNIILNATDLKADNIMLRWDDTGAERKFYFEVIDGDLIWQQPIIKTRSGHYFTLRCILLLFDLNFTFEAEFRRELLEHPAIYFILSWLELIQKDEQQFNLRVQQRAFTESDLHIEDMPTVDRPLKFHPAILPRMLELLQRAQKILASNAELTLAAFIEELLPIYAQYKRVVSAPHSDNILAAYHALHNGPAIEEVLDPTLLQSQEVPDDAKQLANLSCEQAICALLADYRHNLDIKEEYKLLNTIGEKFPFVKKRHFQHAQLNDLLFRSADYLLLHAMESLLACGADVNCANKHNERLLHRVMSFPNLDQAVDREKVITMLMNQVAIELQVVNQLGETPLMTFIRHAINYQEEFIEFVIISFKMKHADLNVETPLGTALDLAVKLKSVGLFSMLIKHGAYGLKEPGAAVKFVHTEQEDVRIKSAVKILSVCNPNFHYKRALTLISNKKRESDRNVYINGEYHQGCYLNSTTSAQLFDAQGDLIKSRKVVDIIKSGELLLYAVMDSHQAGVEIAVTRLHRILGSYTAPYSEIFQCTNRNNDAFPLMLIGAPTGESLTSVLENANRLKAVRDNIDRNSLTKLFFIQALLGQVTVSTDKFVVVEFGEGNLRRFCLVSVFNDAPFIPAMPAPEIGKHEQLFQYLEAFFSVPLDPSAILELTHLDARAALNTWLNMLGVHEEQMKTFFFKGQGDQLTSQALPLAPGVIKSLFARAKTLCEILRKNTTPEFNGGEFLRCAQALFKNVAKSEVVVNVLPKPKAFFAKIVTPRKSGVVKLPKPYGVADAQQELSEIQQDDGILSMVKAELQIGKFDLFDQLMSDYFKQAAVNAITWKGMDLSLAKSILKHIVDAKIQYTELHLVDCHLLNDKFLKKLLSQSLNLRVLNLQGSKDITNQLYHYLKKFNPIVVEINLDRTLIGELHLRELPQLRKVSAANCLELTKVDIACANLTELNLCSSAVKSLVLQSRIMKKLHVSGCVNLDAVDLQAILSASSSWQEFQHLDVPDFNQSGYVLSVLSEKHITPMMSPALVHNGALNLGGMSIRDEQLQQIIDHLTSPDKFSLILHASQTVTSVDLRGCQYISHLAIAAIIAKLPCLESLYASLYQSEVNHIYLGFCQALPALKSSLVTENEVPYLKLTYATATKIERQAIGHLHDFIKIFFTDAKHAKFKVIFDEESISIYNCPLEELCIYQTLFEAFVQRAKSSPRKLLASQQRFTSSIALETGGLAPRQSRTSQESNFGRK